MINNPEKIQVIKQWLGSGAINMFGLPFSGKDTQCHAIAELLGANLVNSGDIIRQDSSRPHVKLHINKGKLAPSHDYLQLILPYLSREDFAGNPLVLNSVGRWSGEETAIIRACEASGHKLKLVLFLDVGNQEIIKRWEASQKTGSRGKRHDDAEHILETRFQEFRKKTMPVIDYYESIGLLAKVDGSLAVGKVQNSIINILHKHSVA